MPPLIAMSWQGYKPEVMGKERVFDGLSNLAIFLLEELIIFSVIRQDGSDELATMSILVSTFCSRIQT